MSTYSIKPVVPLALVILLLSGCGARTFQQQHGWKASDYFEDAADVRLCGAIESGNLDAMKRAVGDGADPAAVGRYGMTPLLWAFVGEDIKVFQWLLQRGADPNVCIRGNGFGVRNGLIEPGTSVTYLSFQLSLPEHFKIVMANGGDATLHCPDQKFSLIRLLMMAPYKDVKERIAAIVDAGGDVDQTLKPGESTATMLAASSSRFDLVLYLLGAGADPLIYEDRWNRQLVHYLLDREREKERWTQKQTDDYEAVMLWLEEHDVDLAEARKEMKRRAAWLGVPLKKLRAVIDREVADRKRRKARE